MTQHTFTLSRAHAVADRLRALAAAKQSEAQATLAGVHLSVAPSAAQKEALAARGQRALEQIDEAREALRAVGTIRTVLAQANAKAGVTELLARVDAARKELQFVESLCGIDLLTKPTLDNAEQCIAATAAARGGYANGVQVSLVAPTALDGLREERAILTAEISSMSDAVNDLNRTTVTIELPAALAKAAGLN